MNNRIIPRFTHLILLLLLLISSSLEAQTSSPPEAVPTDQRLEELTREIRALRRGIDNNSRELRGVRSDASENYNRIQYVRESVLNAVDTLKEVRASTDEVTSSLGESKKNIDLIMARAGLNTNHMDRFWIMICAILVFFMQAGFKALEVGMVRKEHRSGIGMKNLVDWLVVCGCFYLFGFGLMFGTSATGFFGFDLFMPTSETMAALNQNFKLEFFLFQLAFAGTAATIVSGAMSERTSLTSYVLTALVVGGLIYPIFGHWAWGGIFVESNTPWLASLGFLDFAGSIVVHTVGASVALAGVIVIGPRRGRFNPAKARKFRPSDMGYSVLGVFILWFAWWGFNGGSNLAYDDNVSFIILNTNLAGAFAGLVGFLHAYYVDRQNTYVKLAGSVLGGLVAITACCNMVTPVSAIIIGMVAGLVHNYAFDLLLKFRLDDPVGAIPVHGACGIWGALALGIFGLSDQLAAGGRMEQIGVQALGVVVAVAFAGGVSYLFFRLMNQAVGLRVSLEQEDGGYDLEKDGPELKPRKNDGEEKSGLFSF